RRRVAAASTRRRAARRGLAGDPGGATRARGHRTRGCRALRSGRRGRARDRRHRADRPRRARGEGGAGDEHRGGVVDGRRDPARGGMTARLTVYALVAAIFVASLLLWLATPLVGLWLVSKLSDDGLVVVFAVVGIVCPLLMLAFGLVIGRLNAAYLH